MSKKIVILALLVTVIALPLLVRKEGESIIDNPDETLVILSPHSESLWDEFSFGFQDWYKARTGKTVHLDWRNPGGTGAIIKFLDSLYENAFRNYWVDTLGRPWSKEAILAYDKPLELDDTPEDDTIAEAARRAMITSEISCGIDVIFGGGFYDFQRQAVKGRLIKARVINEKPEWFTEEVIPETLSGCDLRDPSNLWIGAVFSNFGIVFNKKALDDLGFERYPNNWEDLNDPRLLGEVALADPTSSGAVNATFDMMVQEQMNNAYTTLTKTHSDWDEAKLEHNAIRQGWIMGLRVIQKSAANARYFTDKSTKPALDVGTGNCAVGMAIDYYGRNHAQNLEERTGSTRFVYHMPPGGSALAPDSIALLRGAPNREVAEAFIEYTLSIEGQKLWDYPVGAPGGPRKTCLRRSPIRKEFYIDPELNQYLVDRDFNPYLTAEEFIYRPQWTSPILFTMRYLIKSCFIDPHDELRAAWIAIIKAQEEGRTQNAEAALRIMEDLESINYDKTINDFRKTFTSGNPLKDVQLRTKMTKYFMSQYKRAEAIAKGEPDPGQTELTF
ncbi:MAG: hypothetical protein Tsb0018_07210 [Opitutales bacterium]|tara:strand:+ start:1877 stop:3550 length:1674 start_codon:yes stop_codon:yes gene_type:complete